ncbi:hypothetical protein ACXJJ3_15765 [Kribbella sp. WER1]
MVPAVLALESSGYRVRELENGLLEASSDDGTYVAEDPIALLGLIKLVELRTWSWQADDEEIDTTLNRLGWNR